MTKKKHNRNAPVCFDVEWACTDEVPCLPKDEAALLPVLVRDEEVHMRGKDLSEQRLAEIERHAKSLGMRVPQALSLRRMMMRGLMGIGFYSTCGAFGDQQGIDHYAAELERSVARLLLSHSIPYMDEEAQKHSSMAASTTDHLKRDTPDFLIDDGVQLYINGKRVHWIECKAFYGAAMFTSRGDERNVPVAKVKRTAERYVASFGPGAFVFRQGYNRHLQNFIGSRHVTLLDATPLDLEEGPFMG